MDKSSIRFGTVFGIPFYLHYSFLLILPFLAYSFGQHIKALADYSVVGAGSLGLSPYVWGLLIALGLFGSVLLHELGHAFVARSYNIKTSGITLMLMGGVAELEEMPSDPRGEAKIAVAGPIVSVLVGIGAYLILYLYDIKEYPDLSFGLSYLGHINIFLACFNLLPAFPMDGGRILRAFLARNRPFVSATKIASNVGRGFAFLFGIWGLAQGNLFLVMIAFFVYMGASQEYHFTLMRTTLDGFRVRDLMTTDVQTVEASMPLKDLALLMLRSRHSGYPVVENGEVIGCITLEDLDKVHDDDASVRDVMTTSLLTVSPDEDIYVALHHMSDNEIGRVPVMENGRLVGILSRSDLVRGFQIRRLGA